MYLIERLTDCNAALLQFNLNKWQPVYQNGHIITVNLCTRLFELLDDLQLVAGDVSLIHKVYVLNTPIIKDKVVDEIIVDFAGFLNTAINRFIKPGTNEALPL